MHVVRRRGLEAAQTPQREISKIRLGKKHTFGVPVGGVPAENAKRARTPRGVRAHESAVQRSSVAQLR